MARALGVFMAKNCPGCVWWLPMDKRVAWYWGKGGWRGRLKKGN